jgi:hypothetical protein
MKFASPEHIDVLARGFMRQAELAKRLEVKMLPRELGAYFYLIRATASDAEAIGLLYSQGYGNQAAMVLRAFVEKVVTFFYLQAVGEDERDAYFQYSAQKTYQLTRQSVEIESKEGPIQVKFQGNIDLSSSPEFKAAVDRFTGPKGNPKTRWSNTSIDKKLAAIKASKIIDTGGIELLVFYIYDDASEALHGTIYGCLFHLGMFELGKPFNRPKDEQAHEYQRHLATSFLLAGSALHDVNTFLFSKTKQQELVAQSKEAQDVVNNSVADAMTDAGSPASHKREESSSQ